MAHVVLKDTDGCGVYTDSITFFFTIFWFPNHRFRVDVIYEVIIAETGAIVDFYLEFHQYYRYFSVLPSE